MNLTKSYHSFNVSDTDGKSYKCSRQIHIVNQNITQVISVLGIKSTSDPHVYGCTGQPIEMMEDVANSLALEIVHKHI